MPKAGNWQVYKQKNLKEKELRREEKRLRREEKRREEKRREEKRREEKRREEKRREETVIMTYVHIFTRISYIETNSHNFMHYCL